MVKEINQNNFETNVLNNQKPVVVDFWASWCGPCKMLAPVMEEVAENLSEKAEFVKVNVDDNPVLAQQYGIASIPTVIVFKDSKIAEKIIGFRPQEEIQGIIEQSI